MSSFTPASNKQQPAQDRRDDRREDRNDGTWSLFDDNGATRGISSNPGSEVFTKFIENAKKRFSTLDKNVDLRLVPLDREVHTDLTHSAVIVAVQYKSHPTLGVAYYTLLLEATGEPLPVLRETFGASGGRGKEIEVLQVTSDALDPYLNRVVREVVAKEFNVTTLQDADGSVVPAFFDVDNDGDMQRLLWNATSACTVCLDLNRSDFRSTDMSTMKRNVNFRNEMTFSRSQHRDANGNLMRADVSVELSARQRSQDDNNNRNTVHGKDKEMKLTMLSGFVEIVPTRQLGRQSMVRRRDERDDVPFAAQLVITDLMSKMTPTPENILLALSTARGLNINSAWSSAFRPRPLQAGEKFDPADIGALNIQGNLKNEPGCGSMVDSRDDLSNADDLGQFIGALVHPDMMVALDVPEGGAQSWYLSVFLAAADPRNERNEEAQRILIGAANVLTGNKFSNYFRADDRIFATDPIRIHAGVIDDGRGQPRDIRNVDYLYAANCFGSRDHQYISDWTDTFLRLDVPEKVRLYERQRMIQAITGEAAKFTGFHQRVVFSKDFLNALNDALYDCEVRPFLASNEDLGGINNTRGYASWASDAMLSGSRYGSQGRGYGDRDDRRNSGRYSNY